MRYPRSSFNSFLENKLVQIVLMLLILSPFLVLWLILCWSSQTFLRILLTLFIFIINLFFPITTFIFHVTTIISLLVLSLLLIKIIFLIIVVSSTAFNVISIFIDYHITVFSIFTAIIFRSSISLLTLHLFVLFSLLSSLLFTTIFLSILLQYYSKKRRKCFVPRDDGSFKSKHARKTFKTLMRWRLDILSARAA